MLQENEVLTQVRALRQEVGSRLDDMDDRLRKIEAELSAPTLQGFGSRLEEMDQRLCRLESGFPAPAINGNTLLAAAPPVEAVPSIPTTTVEVKISPMYDVSLVRVVEAALVAIDGVEAVSLQTLSGETAELQIVVQDNVSLIGGLRRTLPLAFDVSASEDSSFTIALAEAGSKLPRADAVA
jgi:hypothetical protein